MEQNQSMQKMAVVFSNTVQVFFFESHFQKLPKSSDLGRKCRMPFRVPVTIERNRNMHKIALGLFQPLSKFFFFESHFIECLSRAI